MSLVRASQSAVNKCYSVEKRQIEKFGYFKKKKKSMIVS